MISKKAKARYMTQGIKTIKFILPIIMMMQMVNLRIPLGNKINWKRRPRKKLRTYLHKYQAAIKDTRRNRERMNSNNLSLEVVRILIKHCLRASIALLLWGLNST